MPAIVYPPLHGDVGNHYELVGRFIAQCVLIERCVNAAVHTYMTGAQLPQDYAPDSPQVGAVRKLLHHAHINSRLDFFGQILREAGLVSQPKPLVKRIKAVYDIRNKMAHHLIAVNEDGDLVWLDSLTLTPQVVGAPEFTRLRDDAMAVYNECALLYGDLQQVYVPGLRLNPADTLAADS